MVAVGCLAGDRLVVFLETVGEERLRTEEAVVFAVDGAAITQVRVFLQRSTPV